jgi:hypothetical protein
MGASNKRHVSPISTTVTPDDLRRTKIKCVSDFLLMEDEQPREFRISVIGTQPALKSLTRTLNVHLGRVL